MGKRTTVSTELIDKSNSKTRAHVSIGQAFLGGWLGRLGEGGEGCNIRATVRPLLSAEGIPKIGSEIVCIGRSGRSSRSGQDIRDRSAFKATEQDNVNCSRYEEPKAQDRACDC